MTLIQILAGAMALLVGFAAMFAKKGSRLHRRAGLLFVVAIVVMGATGALVAALKSVRISVVAGLLVVYLAGTALLTVRHDLPAARLPMIALTGPGLLMPVRLPFSIAFLSACMQLPFLQDLRKKRPSVVPPPRRVQRTVFVVVPSWDAFAQVLSCFHAQRSEMARSSFGAISK